MRGDSAGAPSTPDVAAGDAPSDRCHRELSSRLGRFLAALDTARGADPIELLHLVGSYVSEDLLAEEATIRASDYPDAAAHLSEHEAFRKAFARLVRAYARYGNDPRVTEQLRDHVVTWLETHLRTADRRLCEHVTARQPGGASGA